MVWPLYQKVVGDALTQIAFSKSQRACVEYGAREEQGI